LKKKNGIRKGKRKKGFKKKKRKEMKKEKQKRRKGVGWKESEKEMIIFISVFVLFYSQLLFYS